MLDKKSQIEIYQTKDKQTQVEVRFDGETVWLSQKQMSDLFNKDVRTISEHIANIYQEKELAKTPTIRKFRIVQKEGKREIERAIDFYNLDVIISVGYRVKSKQGTQFRIWATHVLRDHLIKGYTVNARRLKELQQTVRLIANVAERHDISSDDAKALLNVVADYAYALDLLDDYDHQKIAVRDTTVTSAQPLTYAEAKEIIQQLKKRFNASALFGNEKDQSLHSSLNTVFQTFNGKDLYPSIEEKAAHLLYFLVKNHSFTDGNKRIAAALFLWFLEKNRLLYLPDRKKRIGNNALVAMTLLIAESKPSEKDSLVRIVVNLINTRNQ